jgi:FlaA1/EpsC-like NDP-sugar epimerase
MISRFDKIPKQLAVMSIDAVLIALSLFLSYVLRFNTLDLTEHIRQILLLLPLVLAVRLGVFASLGLYRGMCAARA